MSSPGAPPAETTPLLPPDSFAVPVDDAGSDTGRDDSSDDSVEIDWGRLANFIWPYLLPSTSRMRLSCALSVLSTVLSTFVHLIPPFAFKLAVDTLAENAARPPDAGVAPLFAIALGFSGKVFGSLLGYMSTLTYSMVSSQNRQRFAVNVFRHLQHLDLEYYTKRKTGEVQRVMDRGTESIDTLMDIVVFTLAPTYVSLSMHLSRVGRKGTDELTQAIPHMSSYFPPEQIARSGARFSHLLPFRHGIRCRRYLNNSDHVCLVHEGRNGGRKPSSEEVE